MKKLLTIAFALLIGASLSFAQAGGGSAGTGDKPASTDKDSKKKSGKKGHKGGKKGKKGSSTTTTPPPK